MSVIFDWATIESEVSIVVLSTGLERLFKVSGSEGGELLLLLEGGPLLLSLRLLLSFDILDVVDQTKKAANKQREEGNAKNGLKLRFLSIN